MDMQFPESANMKHIEAVDQNTLIKYYAKAKIFVLPSREEGLALVQPQAIACGLPVVCSKFTGGKDIGEVTDLKEWIFEMKDFSLAALEEEVSKALITLLYKKPKEEKNEITIKTKKGENVKLFFNLGRKDNMKVKDFVGSIAANWGIQGADIGKINILDKFSFVEVPGEFVEDVIKGMKGKQIKGRDCNVEIAEH